jgi:hypothetical protein
MIVSHFGLLTFKFFIIGGMICHNRWRDSSCSCSSSKSKDCRHTYIVDILVWFKDGDNVIQSYLRSNLAFCILRQEDGYFDTDDTMTHEHMSDGGISIDLT